MIRFSFAFALRGLLGGASLLMLAGCGGGGGVSSVSTNPTGSTGSTGGTTTTTPVVPVVNYNDAEYQRSNGAVDAGALTAYNAGASGTGVTIAVLDTGIATVGTEFSGRISSASRDFGGSGTVTDADGHGTAVAAVAAAARDGSQVQGVAYAATILALRTDTAGSCGTTDGCSFNTNTLTTAVDYARTSGAKVINLSLGGSPASAGLTAAINRATAEGIIIVLAAGNDGTAQPDALAQIAATGAARGLVIIAGSHEADGSFSTYADKAGVDGDYYITALGSGVRSFDNKGTAFLYTGTSFTAPIVAGAVALLEQAFPNLTPAQVVALLYSSATDAGAAGVDSTFGHGLLNLAKAFQPTGTLSLAGSRIAVTDTDRTVLSTAMGDAALHGLSLGRAVALDALGRAYTMDVAANVARQGASRPLAQAIGGDLRSVDSGFGALALSSTVARGFAGASLEGLALAGRGFDRGAEARPVNGSAVVRIDRRTSVAIAFAEQGQTLGNRLLPDGSNGGFLVARGPGDTPGFATRGGMSFAMLHRFGRTAVTVTAERGTLAQASPTDGATPGYAVMRVRGQRRFGPFSLGVAAGSLREDGTVLGARLSPALGRSGATTRTVDLDARLGLGGGWSLGAAWRSGWTRTDAGGVLEHSLIASRSAAADLSHEGRSRRFGLRFAMPTRVGGGGLNLSVPTSYDYASGAIGYSASRIGLTPQGREQDIEASCGLRVFGGWMDTNLYLRRQPDNIALASDDLGAALRYSLTF